MNRKLKRIFLILSLIVAITSSFLPRMDLLAKDNEVEQKVVKVGYVISEGYQEGKDGEYKTGYGYEYLQRISYLTGWKYEYVYGSYSQLMRKLEDGEIDLMNGVSYSEGKNNKINYSSYSSGKEMYFIYCADNDQNLRTGDLNCLEGKKIAVTEDSFQEQLLEEWLTNNGIEAEVVTYVGTLGICDALNDKRVDAAVLSEQANALSYAMILNIGHSEYYFGVNKNRPDLLASLNMAMCTIQGDEPLFNDSIVNKYTTRKYTTFSISSVEEMWLNNRSQITIGYVRDYLPFCGTDSKGKPIGGLVDVTNEIIKKLNLESRLKVKYKEFKSHDELIDAVKRGGVDVAFPMVSDFYYSEQSELMETYELVSSTIGVVYKGNYSSNNFKKLAISSHSPMQKICSELYYPDCEIVEVDSAEACLNAVNNKMADGTLFNMSRAQSYLELKRFDNLHVVACSEDVSYCFAVRQGESELLSILNKGISGLNQTFVSETMNDYIKYNTDYTISDFIQEHVFGVLLLAIAIVVLVSIIVIMFIIQRNVNKNAMTDQLTGCKNRMAMNWAYEGHFSSGESVGIIMCDLNGLKKKNDEQGHEMGDRYICLTSELLRECFGNKKVYRIGGDEFVVIIRGEAEEPIKRNIKNFRAKCKDYDVSISLGFAFREYYDESFEDMLKEADNRMYASKNEFYRLKCEKNN